jgi:hypothetical protein
MIHKRGTELTANIHDVDDWKRLPSSNVASQEDSQERPRDALLSVIDLE